MVPIFYVILLLLFLQKHKKQHYKSGKIYFVSHFQCMVGCFHSCGPEVRVNTMVGAHKEQTRSSHDRSREKRGETGDEISPKVI
jgi:hypothetical protein